MRNRVLISIALAVAVCSSVTPSHAATFGTVVPIGGHASDIALDESRGLLYIANFTANRIDVMSLTDGTVHTSMNVAPQPGAISMSPDGNFLLVAHFGNFTAPSTSQNQLTLINLNDSTRQTFTTGDTPLGVAFLADGTAVVVTTSGILQFDPISGALNVLGTFASLATTLPAKPGTFPTQVILASLATSPDRTVVYGVAEDQGSQAFYRFDLKKGQIFAGGFVASPKPLPRVAVSADGSWAMVGMYKIDGSLHDLAQFPNATTSTNIGGNAVDSNAGIIYSQILTAAPQTSSSSSTSVTSALTSASTPAASGPPVLLLMDIDNLTVRDSLFLPENITGREVLTAAGDVLYAVSDSGVMVLPVGRLKQYHRLATNQEDVLVSGNFCNRNVITQNLTITDPGGGNTDFALSVNQAGVTISPSTGITPATVQVKVDPSAFQNQNGTVAIPITMSSGTAVNLPPSVRLLVNNRNPNQRGTIVDTPGTLTDILPDPKRNHFYVVRQDKNQVLVFDSTSFQQVATLRTATTPTQMAISFDQQYLIVGHDNSQFAYVYDLDTLQPQTPVAFPGGHYPRQIAASGKQILALVRDVTGDAPGAIDTVNLVSGKATQLPTLGIYTNSVNPGGVLAAAPNGGSILAAMPDGNVMLYDANADTFTISRKDYTALQGGYAASSYGTYVVGPYLLNASLVTQATLETSSGAADGFAFVDSTGIRTTYPGASSPGVIQRVDPSASLGIKPTPTVEAPLTTSQSQPFLRTLAPLFDHSAIISLSVSGITVLPWTYDAAVAPPKISSIVNAADGTQPVAPGGLISVYGTQMSPVNVATSQIPLPTALGESCLTVNGVAVPMLFVSSTQINGQLPFNVDGNATMTLRTPGGISDNFNFTILSAAPSIFRNGTAGPETGLATIVRADDNQLITPTNPIHPNDAIVIYATGLGRTQPAVDAGQPSPSDPLGSAIIAPAVTLGGMPLNVVFAGLVPGEVGVYQINATVPGKVPQGLSIPLVINQGAGSTTLNVRVVNP
ncbi:MAG TPA: hypothetical protein VMH81_23895 [Bryobacteraceae bacterium]|nr:hypothetical protein [Bryobacteraceae bacterium]